MHLQDTWNQIMQAEQYKILKYLNAKCKQTILQICVIRSVHITMDLYTKHRSFRSTTVSNQYQLNYSQRFQGSRIVEWNRSANSHTFGLIMRQKHTLPSTYV